MRRRHRTLRELLAELRLAPEERREAHVEECLETLYDPVRCACVSLGEREEAELEAERRRWLHTGAKPAG
jgi:hypothetical protein